MVIGNLLYANKSCDEKIQRVTPLLIQFTAVFIFRQETDDYEKVATSNASDD